MADDPPKCSVLLVDDDSDTREMYAMVFGLADVKVLQASNGAQALAAASQWLPDVIVTDLTGPQLDGFELVSWLHTNPRTTRIPVVVLTGRIDATARARAVEVGAEFILKPCLPDDLLAVVFRTLGKRVA